MKAEYLQNQNMNISDSNKPTNAHSEIKSTMKNIDNNINYSDSDDENNNSNENQNIGNSYQDESELNKEEKSQNNTESELNKEEKSQNNTESNSINNSINKESESNNSRNIKINNINVVNKDNMRNKPLDDINPQRPTYTGYNSEQKLTGYSNFFINNYKRALSGEKNNKPNNTFYSPIPNNNIPINRFANSNSKYNNLNNHNNLQTKFVPTNSNPIITKIKRTPQDEVSTNNFKRNLNQDFYSLRNNNNYQTIGNYNANSNLNKTSPNLTLCHYITNVKKLPSKKNEDNNSNFNTKRIYSNEIQTIPNNYRNQFNKEEELPGENKTLNYPFRKPFSSNNIDMPNFQQRLGMSANPYLNNNNKINDLSLTMNYGAFNRTNQTNQINKQPLNFEQALKQNQLNDINNNRNNNMNNNTGRITIVKKLPPISNDIDPKDNLRPNRYLSAKALNSQTQNNLLGNNNINVKKLGNNQNDRNMENSIQNNNMPLNDSYNSRINQQNNMQKLDAANTNRNNIQQNLGPNTIFNPTRPLKANQIKQPKINQNQLLSPSPNEKKREDSFTQNSEEVQSKSSQSAKKKVDISYNDFDGSGWVKNYGGVSRPGKDMMGNQKINQDAIVSITNINDIKDFNIFGVLDGHGPQGHFVSVFASEFIPLQIINNKEIKALNDPEKIYDKLKENNCLIISNAFLSCDEALKKVDFDVLSSGSTCVIIIHIGTHIICANVGDSRGIIVYSDEDEKDDPELNELEVAQLSFDHKPDLPEEKSRILLSGGVVEKMKNEIGEPIGPFRVWAKGADYPGLAMSRSIGDFKGKSVGVLADPGIMEYDLCEASKYIVICSDGVWEFLSNEIVKDFGKPFYLKDDPSGFCHHVINNSVVQWEKNEVIIDDITIVVVFF